MPTHLKLVVSALAVLAAAAMFWYDTATGTPGAARWVALALGPVAVFAIWVFPEAKAKEIRKDVKRHSKPPLPIICDRISTRAILSPSTTPVAPRRVPKE